MAEDEDKTDGNNGQNWAEKIKQATEDFPTAKPGVVTYERAGENEPITKATVHTSQNQTAKSGKGGLTVSITQEYNFATRSAYDSETEKSQSDVYVANPRYYERTVTTETGKNMSKQTISQTREYCLGAERNGSDLMQTVTSHSSHLTETKNNKTINRTTRSDLSIGERTDTVYGSKGTTSVTGTSIASPNSAKLTGVVNVSANVKNKSFTTSVEYEGTADNNGHVSYTPKSEYYVVDDQKTGNTYSYAKTDDGQIRGEVWQNDGTGQVKACDIAPGKQMKKDFNNYKKTVDKLIKQATKCNTAQDYMENTPRMTVSATKEVDVQQQSLDYAQKAKQSAQTALMLRAKAQGR